MADEYVQRGCLKKSDLKSIVIALDEYRGEVLRQVDDPDPATAKLASKILGDIEKAKSNVMNLSCI